MGGTHRVEAIVDATLGCAVSSCERTTSGRSASTYVVEVDGHPGRVLCKIGGVSAFTGDWIEPAVVRLVRADTDVPVPEVLATGRLEGVRPPGDRWALYEYLPGEPQPAFRGLDDRARRRVVGDVGRQLGGLHAGVRFERVGGLWLDGDGLSVRGTGGLNTLELAAWLTRQHPGATGAASTPVLGHGDLFPGNVRVNRAGEIVGVVDWADAHATVAGYALAQAELRFIDWFRFPPTERDRLRRALRDGYTTRRQLPPGYDGLARLYKALWLVQMADQTVRGLGSPTGRRQLWRTVVSGDLFR